MSLASDFILLACAAGIPGVSAAIPPLHFDVNTSLSSDRHMSTINPLWRWAYSTGSLVCGPLISVVQQCRAWYILGWVTAKDLYVAAGARPSLARPDNVNTWIRQEVEAFAVVVDAFLALGAAVVERLPCSPPTKAIRVHSPAGSLRIFACGNCAGRCSWQAGFLGDLPFPPPSHSGVAPYSPSRTWIAGIQESGETGDLLENPPTSGIVQHDSHVRRSGLWPRQESSPVRLVGSSEAKGRDLGGVGMKGWGKREIPEKTRRPAESSGTMFTCKNPGVTRLEIEPLFALVRSEQPWERVLNLIGHRLLWHVPYTDRHSPSKVGAAVARWLGRSPPTTAIRARYPAGSLPGFHMWESCWTMLLVGGVFSGCSRFPRPCIPAPLHPRVSLHVMPGNDVSNYGPQLGATLAERLACSPPTKVMRVQSPAGSPLDFRMRESCRTMQSAGGFSRGFPPPFHSGAAPYSPLIGSQDPDVKSRPNLSTRSSCDRTETHSTLGEITWRNYRLQQT
ncbi:hypothetical protein PR048_025846 [Dryococelus australis]|uniref:Uncharacterized protein n=1 Tax=Dryococelus australis TaxID=614101 RepID=A0ABQ9GJR4_9NEOP|nr:hypothetical protein PR048_025846 [Dryococelus australis]